MRGLQLAPAILCLGLLYACAAPPAFPSSPTGIVNPTPSARSATIQVPEFSPATPTPFQVRIATPTLMPSTDPPPPTLQVVSTATISILAETPVPAKPTATFYPPLILQTPSLPAPGATNFPLAAIHIVQPGPGALVTSPVMVEANAIPGADGQVIIQLIGEDGKELAATTQHFATPQGQRVGFVTSLDFQLPGVSEEARLQIYTHDGRGRMQALSSADFVLLSNGNDEPVPEPDPHEHFILVRPAPNGVAKSGTLALSGYIFPVNHQPVIFELLNDRGEKLAEASWTPANSTLAYQPFSGTLQYAIKSPLWARLVIRQPDVRLPGDSAITSQLVYLNP